MNRYLCILLFIIAVTVIVCLLCNCNIKGGSSGLVYGGDIDSIKDLIRKFPYLEDAPRDVNPKKCYNDIMTLIPPGDAAVPGQPVKDIDDPLLQLGKDEGLMLTAESSNEQKNAFVNYIRGRLYCRASSEEAIRAIGRRMEVLQRAVDGLQQQRDEYREQRDNCRRELEECRRQLEECRRQREECRRQLAECQQQLQDVNRKGIGNDEELERLRIEKPHLEARIRELETQIRELQDRIRRLQERIEGLAGENDRKDQEITRLQAELDECKQRYAKDMNLIAVETGDYVRFCRQLQNLAAGARERDAPAGGFTLSRGGFDKQKDRLNNEIIISAGLSPPERRELLNTLGGIHYGSRRNY